MAKAGLKTWFAQKWVDIGSKKKDGSFAKCGRSKQKADAKRKYPKCVPLAKARSMTEGQRRSAVARKRAAGNTGPKPSKAMGGRILPEKFTSEPARRISKEGRGPKGMKQLQRLPRPKTKSMPSIGKRSRMMGGGMTMMPRAMYGKGGGVCKRGMGRAYGKNS